MDNCYVCLQTPHGDFGELGKVVFTDEDKAVDFCDEKNEEPRNRSLAWGWYYEKCELQ